jgi:hypothetical protein
MPRPLPAAGQEGVGLIEKCRHRRCQHGVVRGRRDLGVLPPAGDDARRRVQPGEPGPHDRRRLDRRPGITAILQRGAELAATGADIEQPSGRRHLAAHLRRHAGDVVGSIDRRGIEFERIDVGSPVCGWKRRDGHSQTRGTSTVTAKPDHPAPEDAKRPFHQDTPPDAFAYDRG